MRRRARTDPDKPNLIHDLLLELPLMTRAQTMGATAAHFDRLRRAQRCRATAATLGLLLATQLLKEKADTRSSVHSALTLHPQDAYQSVSRPARWSWPRTRNSSGKATEAAALA